jgi:hypothetical protein
MRVRSAYLTIASALLTIAPARAQMTPVSIPAWVESDLSAASPAFDATVNGKPVGIRSALGPSSDQIILIVMDVTGDPSLVDPARQALVTGISKLPRNTWVGLLKAEDGLHVLADPGPDRGPVTEAIRNLPNSGNPGLLETVQPALSLADALLRKSPVRVSVLYVTDSNLYNYREDYTNPVINQSDPHDLSRRFPEALIEDRISKLLDGAAGLEAPLFIVHLHNRGDRLNRAYQNGLQMLAGATGGRADFCRSVAEIPDAIAAAFSRISSEWRLILNVPPKVRGVAQVRLRARSGDEELKLSWRDRLEVKETKHSAGFHRSREGSTP